MKLYSCGHASFGPDYTICGASNLDDCDIKKCQKVYRMCDHCLAHLNDSIKSEKHKIVKPDVRRPEPEASEFSGLTGALCVMLWLLALLAVLMFIFGYLTEMMIKSVKGHISFVQNLRHQHGHRFL